MIVLLDAGPLGMVSQPLSRSQNSAANVWLRGLVAAGMTVAIPEVADYEVRRELVRLRRLEGILHLDRLGRQFPYLPISTVVMRLAAEYWATARLHGRPSADPHALDVDVILAAQAAIAGDLRREPVVIATTNVGHLSRFADARHWQDIHP